MRAALYIRVSTDEQAKEGFSIASQSRVLNAWAAIKGAESIIEYVDEGYSAKNLNRPAMQRLINDCASGKLDAVIVWRLDRLTRDLRDMLMLMDDVFHANSVEFISSTESVDTSTPTGRLFLNILGAFAQNERESNAERVKMVLKELSKGARHLGGRPPYGYRVSTDGTYETVPHEAEAVRIMYSIKAAGGSYAQIISALNSAGHKTRHGGPWRKTAIYEMLRNEKYTGVYIYGRAKAADKNGKRNNHASKSLDEITRIDGGMPAIITHDQWKKVQDLSMDGKVVGGQNAAKNIYMLSGLVRCGVCGKTMIISNAGRNRDGSYWRVYRCKNKCVKGVEYRKLDDCVFDFIETQICDPSFRQKLSLIVRQFNQWSKEDSREEQDRLRQSVSQIQRERDNLFKLASMADEAPPKSLLDEINRKDAEICTLEQKLAASENSTVVLDENAIMEHYMQITNIRKLSKEDQKAAAKEIIEYVTIYNDHIDITLATSGIGGAELFPPSLVAFLSFSIIDSFLLKYKFPKRYFL